VLVEGSRPANQWCEARINSARETTERYEVVSSRK
jgi:hypothetical protein